MVKHITIHLVRLITHRAATIMDAGLDAGHGSMRGLGPGDRNGPKWVSEVVETPDGPSVTIDAGFSPRRLIDWIPDLIVARLEQADVSAPIVWPPAGQTVERLGSEAERRRVRWEHYNLTRRVVWHPVGLGVCPLSRRRREYRQQTHRRALL